jgi:hypothetical protein
MEREVEIPQQSMAVMTAITKAELDQQITTARAFPRSIKRFTNECMDMACLSEEVASSCMYALPRGGKSIEGPSARMAEIIQSAWGNNRSGQRIVDEGSEFVTAQGIFHDLERNVMITVEVKRRITDKDGKRFNTDMIGVTGNAASSIAHRNAVLKGVPKAFWNNIYLAARRTAVGDQKTLVAKRTDALAYLQKMGVTPDTVFASLGIGGEQDIGLDELATLRGSIEAIKSGEATIENAFAPMDTKAPQSKTAAQGKPKTEKPKAKGKTKAPAAAAAKPADKKVELIGIDQATALRDKLKEEGIDVSLFCAQYQIGTVEDLPAELHRAAHDWIDKQSAGGG